MASAKCRPCAQKARVVPPLWADSRTVLQVTGAKFTDFTLGNGVVTQIAPADPGRTAIGFNCANTAGNNLFVAPWIDVDAIHFGELFSTEREWFDLFTFGPIVCYPWFGYLGLGGTVRVTECYMQR